MKTMFLMVWLALLLGCAGTQPVARVEFQLSAQGLGFQQVRIVVVPLRDNVLERLEEEGLVEALERVRPAGPWRFAPAVSRSIPVDDLLHLVDLNTTVLLEVLHELAPAAAGSMSCRNGALQVRLPGPVCDQAVRVVEALRIAYGLR